MAILAAPTLPTREGMCLLALCSVLGRLDSRYRGVGCLSIMCTALLNVPSRPAEPARYPRLWRRGSYFHIAIEFRNPVFES